MRVAVIGGGWFGCHIGLDLLRRGLTIDLFESNSDLLQGASGYNQNRLHLGFHYPRSYATREQSRRGYQEFTEHYPTLSREIPQNVYAIGTNKSLIDFSTFVQIMKASQLNFEECDPERYGLRNVTGAITCHERLVETNLARKFFRESLPAHALHLGTAVRDFSRGETTVSVNGSTYDLVVNCTWQQFLTFPTWQFYFEPCVVLVYRGDPTHPAITLMDGPFFTIYPFEENLFTVYSVLLSPRARCATREHAQQHLDNLTSESIVQIQRDFEQEISEYYPVFLEQFQFAGFHRSIRTKQKDASDSRECAVVDDDRLIQVLSGKIDHIFIAAEQVQQCMKKYL